MVHCFLAEMCGTDAGELLGVNYHGEEIKTISVLLQHDNKNAFVHNPDGY